MHRKKKSVFCQLQTYRAAAEQQQQDRQSRAESRRTFSPLPPSCSSYLSVMTLSCAVLQMLLSFLREGFCTTDISVSPIVVVVVFSH